jgi:serine/threonine protein kinase/tetratricopeptide (TPR) repeat protein
MTLKVGDRISHYEIVGVAGSGGMGKLYKARDRRLERLVALKLPQQVVSDRMMREARLIASVSHRSVCQLLDIGEFDGACFLVLEYVEGETLAVRLQRGVFPLPEALDFANAVLNGVAAIHGRGLAHGDLKPANLMLTSDGPRILDFGLANLFHHAQESDVATAGDRKLWGTPGYMAPELLNGNAPTVVSDLFAFGAVLYEAISGAPAFPGSSALARFAAAAQDSPPNLTGFRELVEVDRVLRRAMAKTPNARFASATEFAEELTQAVKVHGRASERKPAVTVLALPFRTTCTDPHSEFLAEALLDAITSELASYRTLNVCPSGVGKRYRASPADWKGVAAETSVNAVITGTLAVTGSEVSLSVQLVKVPEGAVTDLANHHGTSRDLYALQNAAVRDIVHALELNFGTVASRLEGAQPRSDSYDLYLRANLATQDPRRLLEASDLYEQYVRLDPSYAPAWARLGRCYRLIAKYYRQPSRNMKLGREALERAISLDPDFYLAQSYYAQHEADEGRTIDALVRLVRMAKAAPNSADVRAGLTYVCRLCGLYAQSIQFHKAARKLDPSIATSVTQTYFQCGAYVQCLETYSGLGIGYIEPLALEGLGMRDEAFARVTENLARSKGLGVGTLYVNSVHALLSGDADRARREIETAEQNYFLGPEERYYFARKRIFGNIDGGLEALANAVSQGFYGLGALLHDPWLSSVRETEAFQRIVEDAKSGNRRAIDVYAREADGLEL